MIDVQYINRRLKIQEAQIHIGQVGSGNKFFWISANDKSYRFKVNIAFINLLQELLREHEDIADESANEYSDSLEEGLVQLFQQNFEDHVSGPHTFFPLCGFIAKDYAEFYFQGGLSSDVLQIGSVRVSLSESSYLLYLLSADFADDYLRDVKYGVTLKLKGTSEDMVEHDVCAALHYLSLIAPLDAKNDYMPEIVKLFSEPNDFDSGSLSTISQREFPTPSHPTALRFFYQARREHGEMSILYYYKVLEHFFGSAWLARIKTIITETAGDLAKTAHRLDAEQPNQEVNSLIIVLEQILTQGVWDIVATTQLCSERTPSALAKAIYKIRNEIAHGKDEERLDLFVPSIIPYEDLSEQKAVFHAVAKAALATFGNVVN